MKKFLLSLFAAISVSAGFAQKTLIDYPSKTDGISISGSTAAQTVKINGNTKTVDCYALKNGYTANNAYNGNSINLTTEGGFKTGDVITIAGAINNADAAKRATAVLFTLKEDNSTSTLFKFSDFINGQLSNNNPVEESYTLEKDADALYIGRDGGTTASLILIKVVRPSGTPDPEPEPEPEPEPSEVTEVIYANAEASVNAIGYSQITYPDGARLVLLNKAKAWSSASSIKVSGQNYTSIKLSNGAQNIFLAPEGKLINKVTIYSYVNADSGDAYWKEVNNTSYSAGDGLMTSFKNGSNPDVNTYELGDVRSFTFTNGGKQLCFVLKVSYVASADMPETETFTLSLKAVQDGSVYGTVCLPFNVEKPESVEAYTATLSGTNLTLAAIEGDVIPANVGLILKASGNEAFTVNAVKTDAAANTPADNDLQGVGDIPVQAPAFAYVLAKKNNTVNFYVADSNLIIPAHKAYVVASGAANAPLRIVDGTTAISNIQSEKALSGQLFDIQGRQLQNAQGLHIQGGKLQFVK